MIFVTVGTTRFHFDRLLRAVDRAMIDLHSQEKLMVQLGRSHCRFKYPCTEIFSELPFNLMIDCFKKARIIISHGGPATIFLALKYGKNKPLVVPRTGKFGEHVDEHEVFFIQFLKKQGEIEAVFPHEDLSARIKEYLRLPEKRWVKHNSVPSQELIKKLTDFTQHAR